MSESASELRLPYPEYLSRERDGLSKHEWIDGDVFAMAGGTPEHARLQAAVASELRAGVARRPCTVYGADLRIRSRATGIATYADATVVCGRLETDDEDTDACTNPIVIVEVLSPSTEAYDRGEKAAHYRHISSLQEYVLVAQDAPRIEVFRRTQRGGWEFLEAGAGESIELASIGCHLHVDSVFANPSADGAG